jgi:hypothetical protein
MAPGGYTLPAIRPKVPQILCNEKLDYRPYFMPESAILSASGITNGPKIIELGRIWPFDQID